MNSPLTRRSTTHVLPVLISPSSTIFKPRSQRRLVRLFSAAFGCGTTMALLDPAPGSSALLEHPPPITSRCRKEKEERGKRKKEAGTQNTEKGKKKRKGHVRTSVRTRKEREMKKRKAVVVQMSVGERERMVEEDRTKTQENVQSGSVQKTRSATRQRLSLFAPTHQRERKEY